ncbi:unnamed protein product [Durusdinium trenchii]|uniref:Uncharacterized protein n=1 Tax=Durusdinium trenchii TaxID=1381693 RepID=A0ABP0SI86_9DINO
MIHFSSARRFASRPAKLVWCSGEPCDLRKQKEEEEEHDESEEETHKKKGKKAKEKKVGGFVREASKAKEDLKWLLSRTRRTSRERALSRRGSAAMLWRKDVMAFVKVWRLGAIDV